MLTIRPEQMEAFDSVADRRIAEKLVALLKECLHGALEEGEAALALRRIRAAIPRARRRNLRWEISLADFAMLDLKYGPDFDSHPEVAPVLSDLSQAANPGAELFSLFSKVPARVWTQLRDAAVSMPGAEGRLHARLLDL